MSVYVTVWHFGTILDVIENATKVSEKDNN